MYINNYYFPALLGSNITFRCNWHYIMDVPCDMIAALALKGDIANVQLKLEWVLRDCTDVLAHDDDHSSNGGSTVIPLLQELTYWPPTSNQTIFFPSPWSIALDLWHSTILSLCAISHASFHCKGQNWNLQMILFFSLGIHYFKFAVWKITLLFLLQLLLCFWTKQNSGTLYANR